jgi:hypothetical protein
MTVRRASAADCSERRADHAISGRTKMDQRKVQLLVELSTFHDPDPRKIYARVADVVAAHYSGTAMVNLLDGESLQYHLVVSDIPELCALTTLPLQDTF